MITHLLSNPTVTLLLLALVVSLITLWLGRGKHTAWEIFLRNYIFWGIGITYLYNFVMHVFFAEMTAKFIGWSNSPFQYEVGYASLGFSLVAFFAYRSTLQCRFAAVLGPAMFLWGAAIGHIHQIVTTRNLAPGNAGSILWTDILSPVIGFTLLFFVYRQSRRAERGTAANP